MIIGEADIDVRGRTSAFSGDIERGLGGAVGAAAKVGGAITGALAIGTIIKSIGSIGVAYQDSLNTFSAVADKAQLQAAGGLDAVGDAATRLGNDLQLPNTSAADAANAMTELAKAGLSVNDTMAAAKGTLQLAAAGSLEEADAARITANALNTFGLEGTHAADVANILANAANVSSGEVSDFAMGLAQGGLAAKNAGLSIDETAGALALFANNGLRGSDAGTSLKTMLQRLVPQSNTAKQAMSDLGLTFTDAHGRFLPLDEVAQQLKDHLSGLTQSQRAQALQTIFGSDAVRAATVLYHAGAKGIDQYVAGVDRSGGAAAVAAAKAKGLGGALRGLQSQAETAALGIFNAVAPTVEGIVRDISAGFPKATAIVGDLADIVGGVLVPALHLTFSTIEGGVHVVSTIVEFFDRHRGVATALAVVLTATLIPALARSAAAAGTRAYEALAVGMYKTTISAGVLAKSFNPITAAATIAAVGVGLMWEHDKKVAGEAKQAADDYVTSLKVVPTSLESINTALDKFRSGAAMRDTLAAPDVHGALGAIEAYKELGRQYEALQVEQRTVTTNEGRLQSTFGLTRKQVEALAAANDIDLSGSLSTITTRMRGAIAANEQSHHPLQQARADVEELGSSSNSAADDVKELTSALALLAGDALSADQQAIAFRNDIDALDKALRKSGGAMGLNNKAARDARDAFDSAAQQAISHAEAEAKLKGGVDRARASLTEEIQTLRQHAGNSDYAKAALGRLRGALDELPGATTAAVRGLRTAGAAARGVGNSIGTDMGSGLIAGLEAMIPHATLAGKILVQQTAKAMRLAAETGSPSKLTRRIGRDVGKGYELGLLDSVPGVLDAAQVLIDAVSSQHGAGLSNHDVNHAINRAMRSDADNAERDRDHAIAQLGRARDHLADANKELEKQTRLYEPLRREANKAAREVDRLQDAINAEEHRDHPNEKRLKALRREQDEARKTADETDRMADHAQKAYDRAEARASKWADAVTEDSKRVRQAQRDLADAFRQEQVDAASAILDALSAEVDALTAKADSLRGVFADAVEAGTSLSAVLQSITTTTEAGVTVAGADPVGAYIGTLTTTLADSTTLAADIGTLVGMGLNDATIAEIIKLGPAAGTAFADALIAAGPEAIDQINALIAGIGDLAVHGMDDVAAQLYGPGAAVLQSLIDGIESAFPELDATIDTINAKLATIGSAGAAVSAATNPAGMLSATQTTKLVSIAPKTTITVQGDVSKASIDRLQAWADNHDAELVRLAQTGVK